MGTLAHLAPVLGILAGIIIAKLAKSELKQGEKYFQALQYILFLVTVGTAVWQRIDGQTINIDIPLFLFFIPVGTRYRKNYFLLTGIAVSYLVIALLIF